MHIPELISDLAIMMLTAGVITIIFKKIKQPLILGYILAGFLLSPYFPWFSTVIDTENIHTWSEIGIIFLMFHLGLEFNLHKLAKVGSTGIITCIVDVFGMLLVGYVVGNLLGFSDMDSICLGGMLSMSSTTIIIKVFDELKIKEKYAEGVFGTLVIQDIVGIFMMVILSTAFVRQNVSGIEVAGKLFIMMLYLVVWLILGIYLLPTFMEKTIKYMNDEMLLVVSIGICFGMVLLADWLGFSTALGAFLSGSLIAGTMYKARIEELTRGVKDLFGAVFFISVGMMVDPNMIVKYIVPIIVITIATLVGKLLFNSLGMVLSGQPLSNSISSGFALAQIGEFAFIIASLGTSLKIIDDFIYPIVVSVSVITTFTTPFLIKIAPKFIAMLRKVLPEGFVEKINKYTSPIQAETEKDSEWHSYIKKYFIRLLSFGGLMLITALGMIELMPLLAEIELISTFWAKIICIAFTYIVMALFTAPLMNRHNTLFTSLWLKNATFRLPLIVLNMVKIVIITIIAIVPLRVFFGFKPIGLALVVVLVLILFSRKGFVATWYLELETHFLKNFNERIIKTEEDAGNKQEWLDEKLHIISFIAEGNKNYTGKTLIDLSWGKHYNIYVVKIRHNGKHYLLPDGEMKVQEGDKVFVVGEEKAILNFYKIVEVEKTKPMRTLKEFMDSGYPDIENALAVSPIKIKGDERFSGKSIKQGNLRNLWKCLILGVQKDGYPIIMPDPNLLISKGDILWVMGSNNNVGKLILEYME